MPAWGTRPSPPSCAGEPAIAFATSARCAPRPAERLRRLGIRDRRFGWPLEMVLLAADAGWRVAEVPVSYAPRTGRSKVTGTVRGTLRTVQDMSRVLR